MLVSENYAKKQWTNHERRAAQARAISENQEYILPLRLDDTKIDSILPTVGYIDYRNENSEVIVEMLNKKLGVYYSERGVKREEMTIDDVFSILSPSPIFAWA